MRIPAHLFSAIGERLVEKIQTQDHHLLVVSVDAHHAHLLVELSRDRKQIKRIVGTWKQAASHAARRELPGRIWAEDCDPEPMRDRQHQLNTFAYIARHAEQGAWVWRFDRDGAAHG